MKMTKELDARARAYAKKMCDEYGDEQQVWTDSYNTYIEIAAEQRAVDEADYTEQMRQLNEEWKENLAILKRMLIDKATEWFANYLFEIGYPDDWVRDNGVWQNGAERFIKAMED